jgi:hypothetical protein
MNPQLCPVENGKYGENHFSNLYLPEQTQIQREKRKHIFFVDSRDVTTKNNDFDYTIIIDTPYKNVHSIELKGISFPKIEDENYVIIDIEECRDRLNSIDGSGAHRSFAICYFDNIATGIVQPMRGSDFDRKVYIFNPTLQKFGKIHVRFKKQNGAVVQPLDVNNIIKHTLLFEITTYS